MFFLIPDSMPGMRVVRRVENDENVYCHTNQTEYDNQVFKKSQINVPLNRG